MPGLMDELIPSEDESVEKILVRLMQGGEDIAMKTDLPKPLNVVRLQTLADWLTQEGFIDSGILIRSFVTYYMHNQVSWKRRGRGEIVKALTEKLREEERSRWTGRAKEDGPEL